MIIIQRIVQTDHVEFHFWFLINFQTIPMREVPQFLTAESGLAPTALCIATLRVSTDSHGTVQLWGQLQRNCLVHHSLPSSKHAAQHIMASLLIFVM